MEEAGISHRGAHNQRAADEHHVTHVSSFNGRLQQFQFSETDPAVGVSRQTVAGKERTGTASVMGVQGDGVRISKAQSPKKKRTSSKYAPPAKYSHLKGLTDVIEPGLICVFVGFNPGVKTALTGHAYAHPSNMFWKLLHRTGLTDRQLRPDEDGDLPRLYSMGNTNLVSRPTKDAAELSREEQVDGVPVLEAKIRKYKPEAVCIVGKSIWENIWKHRYGSKPRKNEFMNGWQDEKHNLGKMASEGIDDGDETDWPGARVFVATSTSGLDASTKPAEKEAIWRPFGEWVSKRREERAGAEA